MKSKKDKLKISLNNLKKSIRNARKPKKILVEKLRKKSTN